MKKKNATSEATCKKANKILALCAVLALALSNFIPIFNVLASAPGNTGVFGDLEIGGAVVSMDDVTNGDLVNFDFGNNNKITVTGAGLYSYKKDGNSYHVAGNGEVTVTAIAGAGYNADLRYGGNLLGQTEAVYNLVNSNPVRVDGEFTQSNTGNTNSSTIDYTYAGSRSLDFRINDQFIETESLQFDGNKHINFSVDYNANGADTVTFTFNVLWIYVIDGLSVNGVSPYLPSTREELTAAYDGNQHVTVDVVVPISDTYTITSSIHEAEGEEVFMGNFLWDNDITKLDTLAEGDERRDDIIGHGTLEFVKAVYGDTEYDSLEALNAAGNVFSFGENEETGGGATFPVGTKLTVRLLPEPGYQLTSFGINGGTFEPQENVGEYTFEIRPGNGHFAAEFEAIEDAVVANADAVEAGSIELNDGELDYGTAMLNVEEADLDGEDIAGFESAAGDYEISTYLDISLYQITYKGNTNADDAWKDQLQNLDHEATITLQLEAGIDGNEIVIVHQKHDGTYEVIPTVYDPITNTITFKTSSFSNYAIASRVVASPDTGSATAPEATSSANNAMDSLAIITIISFAVFGIAIISKKIASSNTDL